MENKSEVQKGSMPDFSGDGVTVWKNVTKNGDDYLTIQLFGKGNIRVNAWKVKTKKEFGVDQELINSGKRY